MSNSSLMSLLVIIGLLLVVPTVAGQLRVGFYNASCPRAELIIQQVVQKRFASDPSITAALLRMHFHDCFVKGCDASILIDSTKSKSAEKDAGPNLTVRGFDLIDDAKTNLEAACPGTVSCADIITLATRDSVALAGGPSYNVPTGRRDGLVSDASLVSLPGPDLTVPQALRFFTAKGLNLNDMVTLLGGHSVGVAQCTFFQERLSNFRGTGKPDPDMDPAFVSELQQTCGKQSTAFLDQNTSFVLDNQYYNQVLLKRGVLRIDQELTLNKASAPIVSGFASNAGGFQQRFAAAMVKMGSIEVLVRSAGEIRKNCRVFNPTKQ